MRRLPFLLSTVLVAFLVLPVLTLLWRGLGRFFVATLRSQALQDALRVSLLSTGICVLLLAVLVTPVAWVLARRQFVGKAVLDTLLDLPIVLPPVVAGLGLLLTFGQRGLLGRPLELAGIEVAFSPAAVVMAQLFVSAPLYLKTLKAGFVAADHDAEEAARIDGAGHWQVFWYVTLPLALPFALEGLVLAWARALGEFGATILFAGSLQGQTRTIPLAIYSALESDLSGALVLSAVMVVVAFGVLLLVRLIRPPERQ